MISENHRKERTGKEGVGGHVSDSFFVRVVMAAVCHSCRLSVLEAGFVSSRKIPPGK